VDFCAVQQGLLVQLHLSCVHRSAEAYECGHEKEAGSGGKSTVDGKEDRDGQDRLASAAPVTTAVSKDAAKA
jgi:hypothetical protein